MAQLTTQPLNNLASFVAPLAEIGSLYASSVTFSDGSTLNSSTIATTPLPPFIDEGTF